MKNEYIIDLQKSKEKLVVTLNNLISLPLVKRDLNDENILCATSNDALGTSICKFLVDQCFQRLLGDLSTSTIFVNAMKIEGGLKSYCLDV